MALPVKPIMAGVKKLSKFAKESFAPDIDILSDVAKQTKKVKKTKKPKPKVSKKPKPKVSKKPKATEAKGRGRKRIPRGRISAAVQKIMDEEGVTRKEAIKILAARQKAAAKAKSTKTTTPVARKQKVPKRWRGFLAKQRSQMRETDPNYVPPGGAKMTRIKTGPESVPVAQRVQQGPARSQIPPLPRGEQSKAQFRRRVMQGLQGVTDKGQTKDIGQWAPPRQDISEAMGLGGKRGMSDAQLNEIAELAAEGKLTIKKEGGSIKSKRKSASKPKGVGQAMRGWGATMKRRT